MGTHICDTYMGSIDSYMGTHMSDSYMIMSQTHMWDTYISQICETHIWYIHNESDIWVKYMCTNIWVSMCIWSLYGTHTWYRYMIPYVCNHIQKKNHQPSHDTIHDWSLDGRVYIRSTGLRSGLPTEGSVIHNTQQTSEGVRQSTIIW